MNIESLISLKVSGIIILLSVLLPLLIIIIIARGDFSGFQASIKGIEGVGASANILGKSFPVGPISLILTFTGFGILTILFKQNGDIGISTLAFIFLIFSQVFILFQSSFHGSITVWGANELTNSGSVPDMFQPLWKWMYSTVQQVYVYTGLIAMIAYGLAIFQTGLLPHWLGWFLVGWSTPWLIFFLIMGDNLPLVLYVAPIVVGITAFIVDKG